MGRGKKRKLDDLKLGGDPASMNGVERDTLKRYEEAVRLIEAYERYVPLDASQ